MRRLFVMLATVVGVLFGSVAPASAGNNITDPWWGMIVYNMNKQPTLNVGTIPVQAAWRSIETQKGVYDFSRVDADIAAVRATDPNRRITLNFWGTPVFYASKPTQTSFAGPGASTMTTDIGAWTRFIQAAVRHYGTTVAYMAWNEPCVSGFWMGTKAQMVQLMSVMYTEVKAIAPTATVVGPPCPIRLSSQKTFVKALYGTTFGGKKPGNVIDVASVNPYPVSTGNPEAALANYNWFKTMIAGKGVKKPVWVTEVNYGMISVNAAVDLPTATEQAYVIRTQALFAGSGTPLMTWWSWDAYHQGVYLTTTKYQDPANDFKTLTPAGRSWQVGYSWLNNTSVDKCVKNSAGVYSCVARGGGEVRRIYWRVSGTSTVAAPATSFSKEDVNGTPTAITPGTKLTITTSPIMVRATA